MAPTTTDAAPSKDEAPYSELLELHTIHHEGRDITFSTSPNNNGSPPVLFFYPVGAGRRMLLSFYPLFSDMSFICVNRPGKGGTSSIPKESTHLETVLDDVICVLDSLEIPQVSVVTMCAGTPFAMAFCTQYPERTTGKFMGISSWIQPADCGYQHTKLFYHIGTQQPRVTGPLAGTLMSTTGMLVSSFVPTSWFTTLLKKKLSPQERIVFEERYSDTSEFCNMFQWMQQDTRGGVNDDVVVLLSGEVVDYEAFSKSCKSLLLWHGTNDSMVPYTGAEWLSNQLPNAALHTIANGTHEGCMFLLHSKILDSLKTSFGRNVSADEQNS